MLPYAKMLMDLEITDAEIHDILRKISINNDVSPITRVVMENDREFKKVFLRVR